MIIGIDVDNVLADYNKGLARVVANSRRVCPTTLPEVSSWGFSEWGFETEADFKYFHKALCKDRGLIGLEVKPHAIEVVNRLIKAGHHIRIVTQRASTSINGKEFGREVAKDTLDWLYLKEIPFHDICFLDNKCDAIWDIALEDANHHLEAFIAANRKYIAFDYLYNSHIPGPRVSCWSQVEALLDA